MAEDPEQVLPEKGIAAALGIEEGPVERALRFEQEVAGDRGGKANRIIPATTSKYQAKSGMRLMRVRAHGTS